MNSITSERLLGVLLPVFSLPGTGERGGFADVPKFIAFLAQAGIGLWQVLPLGPTHEDHSPYLSLSAHAGNTDYLDPDAGPFAADLELDFEFVQFCDRHKLWLDDFALFTLLRDLHDRQSWFHWPQEFRDRNADSLARIGHAFADQLKHCKWQQFRFFKQWTRIRTDCNTKGIRLFGDIPLYVSHDSADVWVHREFFCLDAEGMPLAVAGVPPDYFSATGQRWGNPLYNWGALKEDGYSWWIERIRTQMALYDLVRIDHFRGLQAYWSIPCESPDAIQGAWCEGPGKNLLDALFQAIPELKLVAEDLGTITLQVTELRRAFGIPGMRVLQFGFDGIADNPHSPQNLGQHNLVYTGTHDNDTSLSWFHSLPAWQADLVTEALQIHREDLPWSLVASAMSSPADTVVVPMQDLLGLGANARINTPGTTTGNWNWRLAADWPEAQCIDCVKRLRQQFGR